MKNTKALTTNTGQKEQANKTALELDFDFLFAMAKRMEENKVKYGSYNWHLPIDSSTLEDALLRHAFKLRTKEADEESYTEHLAAIACNAMMLFYQKTALKQ
jgi:hypothetical protein